MTQSYEFLAQTQRKLAALEGDLWHEKGNEPREAPHKEAAAIAHQKEIHSSKDGTDFGWIQNTHG